MRSVISDDAFNTLLNDHSIVIVLFKSNWNDACRFVLPAFKALRKQYPKYTFTTVDVDVCRAAAADVEDLPTFRVYVDTKHTGTYVGTEGNDLRAWVESIKP